MKRISIVVCLLFTLQYSHAQVTITGAEYYWDTDPGQGSAKPLTISTASDSIHITKSIPVSGLLNGFHNLYVRVRDNNDKWSLPEQANIYIYQSAAATQPKISRAEYFWDTDPGEGTGHEIAVSASADSVKLTASIPSSGLSQGFHTLYVRTKDNGGRWSLVEQQTVYIYKNSTTTLPGITAAEYFWDTDPGYGHASQLNVGTHNDSVNFNAGIVVNEPAGFHQLYFRTKDANGIWSLPAQQNVYVSVYAPVKDSVINAAEYFIDNDPGEGKGTNIIITHPADSVNQNFTIKIPANLDTGYHIVYVRTRTSHGLWGVSESAEIHVGANPLPVTLLYFRALLRDGSTNLSWETTAEINTALFEVQRSLNGSAFETIASQPAAGNSTVAKQYNVVDVKPPAGTLYYRLKEIDKDDKTTYSLIIKVDNNSSPAISLYPNPATNFVRVNVPAGIQPKTVLVYNNAGQLLMQRNITGALISRGINVSALAAGRYQMVLVSKDGRQYMLAFIKQ
ncbi:MAG TPA: T9SS type A sorting domain-containing protein [Chitinophagaceae bacterium]|nr:T9SS type A sorting domain-containing protein [Chitinophagaceae bacterium]